MPPKLFVVIGGVTVAVITAILLAVFVIVPAATGANTAGSAPSVTPSPTRSVLYRDEAPQAAEAIRRLNTEPDKIFAKEALGRLGGNAKKALPTGTVVKPLPKTWHASGDSTGSMLISVKFPGAAPKPYLVYMTKEDNGWKVLGTIEVTVDK